MHRGICAFVDVANHYVGLIWTPDPQTDFKEFVKKRHHGLFRLLLRNSLAALQESDSSPYYLNYLNIIVLFNNNKTLLGRQHFGRYLF